MFLVLTNARGYSVSPFSVGALFALMWCGLYLPVIASEYLLANIILINKVADIYSTIATVFVLLVVYFIHKRIKKPMNVAFVGLYTLLSQVVSLYYIYHIGGWLDSIIFAIVCVIFLYVCVSVFQVVVLRGWFYKLTLDEMVCLITLIIVMTFGIAEIYIFDCALYKFVAIFLVLLCVGVNKKTFSLVLAISIGLGVSIVSSSLLPIGEIVILALVANMFSYPHKYKISLITIIGAIVTQIYFVGIEKEILYSLIPICFAIICFLCIPNKTIDKLADRYLNNDAELSVRNVVSSTRKSIKHRMGELSAIFEQMKNIHLGLIKQQLSKSQVVSMLSGEVSKSLCGECKHKNHCYKGLGIEGVAHINKLIEIGLKKGKVNILDLPSSVAQKCGIVNLLIGKINQLVASFQEYDYMLKDVNNVKFLLAEQMGAVSRLLLDLGQDLDKNIDFDNTLHNKILNGLLANNIICSEVLIFSEKNKEVSVVVIVKGDNAYNPMLEKVISKSVNLPMTVVEIEPTEFSDYYSVKLVRECGRDIVFGISNVTKTGSVSSGDSHSLIRLGNNKYLLALCDGMGSGENARKMSALTMGLVENFYKAGFEDEFIINNINNLLTISNQESFSTLDLCVIDLSKEIIDFIKLGATYGVIKREHYVEKVETGTLPLGVLGEVKPSISHCAVSNKDMIIMVTDGITDAFEDYENFAEFVNAIVSINPQVVAQTILDEAILRNGSIAKDDMTVLVARTFIKRK
ncbi:MAG: SpoIIE family protein phosphatase [Clostridia bacterium]|nr:SpoIIE family protein phosphatase [Clostridia bacterium]